MYKPTPLHILFDTLVTGLTCTASATTWWGLAGSGKTLKVSVWQEFMDIGKDRFSLLSSCADLVFNEAISIGYHDVEDMARHLSILALFPIFGEFHFKSLWIGIEKCHYRRSSPLEPNKIVTKKRWLWLRGPDDDDYDGLILANLHIRPGAHSSSPWQPLIHPAAPSYGISLDIVLLRRSSSPWQEQIRVDIHMSVSGSAKARKLSGGHMGTAHLVRFGGRKMGKKNKRALGNNKRGRKWRIKNSKEFSMFEQHQRVGRKTNTK